MAYLAASIHCDIFQSQSFLAALPPSLRVVTSVFEAFLCCINGMGLVTFHSSKSVGGVFVFSLDGGRLTFAMHESTRQMKIRQSERVCMCEKAKFISRLLVNSITRRLESESQLAPH